MTSKLCSEDNFVKVWNNTFQISTNAPSIQTTVILMRTVQTPKGHSTARVVQDTLEMESHALVSFSLIHLVGWVS